MSVVAYLKEYLAEKTASMATQVVMFSVLLFGTSGVVLDFGRVYSEHSIMQSFTDQAALAADAELSRTPGSIGRAVDAVFGGLDAEGNDLAAPLTKGAVFSSGEDNQFNISHLVFLSDLGADDGAQSSMTGIQSDIVYVAFADGGSNGDQSTAALEAKYVIAVAQERSVSNTLISLINSGAETSAANSNIVRTVAAATKQVNYCGEFSNLVMCSPRSAMEAAHPDPSSAADLGEFMGYFEGARFAHITDYTNGSEQHRLYRRRNPAMGSTDDNGGLISLEGVSDICNRLTSLPGGLSTSDTDTLERYQAICHLAAATPRDHCIGETLEIVAAEPEVITTALNVAFNMWDAPANEVIHDWPGTTLATAMPLFQPDRLIMKGKVWETDQAVRLATSNAFGLGGNDSSRLHYKPFIDGLESSSTDFDLILPACLRSATAQAQCGTGPSSPGIAPYIGSPATTTALNAFYQDNYPNHFAYVSGNVGVGPSVLSFFDVYLQERDIWTHATTQLSSSFFDFTTYQFVTVTHANAGDPLTMSGEDASLADQTPFPEYLNQTADLYIDTGPASDASNSVGYDSNLVDPDDPTTRRRMSIPLVDCSGMTDPDGDGIFDADVLEFVDMYLMQPPRPVCLNGTDQCNNADIVSSTVFTEFVEKTVYIKNTFPELVR